MLQSFFVRHGGKYHRILFDDIIYIEACKNYVCIVTMTQNYSSHVTMKQVEETLPQNLFCRIHRSCIVSINKIQAFDHEFVYLNKQRLPLGPQYVEILKNKVLIPFNELSKKGIGKQPANQL